MIDEIDMKILKILMENARATYNEIAKRVGLSDVAVIKRIRRLEKDGVIKKYTIIVDPKKLGYSKVSITGINVDPASLFKVIQVLKDKPYIKYIAITSGDHSLIAVIWGKDSNDIMRIHKEIEQLEGVQKLYPSIVLDVIKEDCPLP
ncbi:transcriptional regulator, AsnC family [Staphylothermus marinus F1]|uniref:Transcriptional regulator, AsnC family n=1 Tax=Staphylothermus marinus (strain ATCC 43588 / DSM 3639 / JCM 9404 / F1) TaxID=399550 RepID=A3DKK1_STAMF|nr:Lrp/AsnC family transcriptional regulator [Staphylothermus marinus]ABN69161.1 transcriptional regulator, AsnC family [Staphylothermus marinus F1]